MNKFRIAIFTVVFLSLTYLIVNFFRNYNSPENIEKRCILKFEKYFKKSIGKSPEEWNLILDEADKNYLNCMGIPQY